MCFMRVRSVSPYACWSLTFCWGEREQHMSSMLPEARQAIQLSIEWLRELLAINN